MNFRIRPIHRAHKGMTMMEMIVVSAIIITLASILAPALNSVRRNAEWSKVPRQMTPIITAFHDYALEHNNYFPPAILASGGAQDALGEEYGSGARWLDTTIYAQLYPDRASRADDTSQDVEDNTTADFSGSDGAHLDGTVFLVLPSVKAYPDNKNNYDHSFCLNRDLIADSQAMKGGNPEYAPRNRNLYIDDTRTMLIIEASEGDNNSIAAGSTAQLEFAQERYSNKFLHVGFMDGHVERRRVNQDGTKAYGMIPLESTSEDGALFWTGAHHTAVRGEGITPNY